MLPADPSKNLPARRDEMDLETTVSLEWTPRPDAHSAGQSQDEEACDHHGTH